MLLQRNLFSIYRIVIKTPKPILILALLFTIFVAITQFTYINKIDKTFDLSGVLFSYMITKNQARNTINKTADTTIIQNSTNNESNVIKSNDYTFLDDSTILHFRIALNSTSSISINQTYKKDDNNLPFMMMVKNQHLLALTDREQDYYLNHGITYDVITIPSFETEQPLFVYFFLKNMQNYEIMMHSLRQSFIALDIRFNFYLITKNITQIEMRTNQLYLAFYLQQRQYPLSFNFFEFMSMKFLPSAFFKLVYCIGVLIVCLATNVFIGLLVRYLIISFFTVFLFIYDRCNVEGQGWVHQYMVILYRRYDQNRIGTLKIMLFYIVSNLMMPLLLALGAYCTLFKLIMPSIPLLVEEEAVFFFKTMFFIEIFHYLFSRSRTTIKFFPIFSFICNFTIITIACLKNRPITSMLLNLNVSLQIISFIVFMLIEKLIVEQNEKGLEGPYCPSLSKPRMMFFAGYDISWEQSLPPIWTYFTKWFDYSYFNESDKSLIQKDYQLLYGRMLGLNDRQQIPEYDVELREQQMVPALHDEPSNEMNLVQLE